MAMSVRSSNCLRAAEIKTLGELVVKTEAEMLKYRNFGRKSLKEIADVLQNMGLRFEMEMADYEQERTVEEDEKKFVGL